MNRIARGHLSKYFTGVAVKALTEVEVNPKKSNQHEFNGTRPLKRLLGDEEQLGIVTRFIWLGDEQDGISDDGFLSWYDSRKGKPRSAEWRLYYPRNSISDVMKPGDTLFLGRRPDASAMVIVTPAGSTIQNQLLWMFGLDQPELEFQSREIDKKAKRVDFALRYVLDEIGIEPEEPDTDELDRILERFGARFPTTKAFSQTARDSVRDADPRDDPDAALIAWLEREELLFKRLERHIVADRLISGFVADDAADVDGFLSFSLSVQNRRKARAGQSLENHLEAIFQAFRIRYERGVETENRNKPDFLFPGQSQYRDETFPTTRLTMLGAKSTCKDRYRQVLAEAARITHKHLITLEPGISEYRTSDMRANRLQLILPASLHETYSENQRRWLITLHDFLGIVSERQA